MKARHALAVLPFAVLVSSCAATPAPSAPEAPAASVATAPSPVTPSAPATTPTPPSAPTPPAPATPAVELSAESSHHSELENKYVHVFKVEVLAGASTLKHRHGHDFVAVTIGAAELSNEVEGKPPAAVKQADGLIRFNEAGLVHAVRNTASTPFRNVTIELLQDDPAHKALLLKWDEESGVLAAKGGSREIVFVKDGARVSSMVLQPGGAQPKRQHSGPEFLVAVTDLELGKGARAVKLKAGEVKWFDTGLSPQLTNTGKQEAKLVLLEFR